MIRRSSSPRGEQDAGRRTCLMHSNKDDSAVEAPAGEQVGGGGERLAEGGVLERPGHPAGEGDGAGEFHGEAEGRDDWAGDEVG